MLLPLEVNQLLGTVEIWDGIPMLEESEDLYKGLTIDVSHLSDDLCEATDGMFDCALIKQEVSGEQLTQIMEAVRDRVSHEFEGIIDIFD